MSDLKITPDGIRALKGWHPIAALTAYDYPMARMLDEVGVPLLLVGDSLGMMQLGYPDTTHVTMDDMVHHVRAAARAKCRACLGGDLPYRSYDTPAEAVKNARRLVAAGAEYVKLEGGSEMAEQIRAIRAEGIPVCGHLGMLPQHVLEEGGKYRIKGRQEAERIRLLADARAVTEAGVFAMVLELVTPPVAGEIRRSVNVPTIGIGSGPDCDGQILVTHDLVGGFPWFTPKFVKPKTQTALFSQVAVREWMDGLRKQEA